MGGSTIAGYKVELRDVCKGGGGVGLSWAFCMVVRLGWESGIEQFRLQGYQTLWNNGF